VLDYLGTSMLCYVCHMPSVLIADKALVAQTFPMPFQNPLINEEKAFSKRSVSRSAMLNPTM